MKFNFKWKTLVAEYVGIVAIVTFLTMHVLGDSFVSAVLNATVMAFFVSVPIFAVITGWRFIKYQQSLNNLLLNRVEKEQKNV